MTDACKVRVTERALREVRKDAKKHVGLYARVLVLAAQVQDLGWKVCTDTRRVAILDEAQRIGEIRETERPSFRAFFYWYESDEGRELFITHVEPKSNLSNKNYAPDIRKASKRRDLDEAEGDDNENETNDEAG